MENERLSNGKEILFIPTPTGRVLGLENQFKDHGVRFAWLDNPQDLATRVKSLPPFLLIMDLSRWDGPLYDIMPCIEGGMDHCKMLIFGRSDDQRVLAIEPVKELVPFMDCLDGSTLREALQSVLNDGWGPFKRHCVLKRPYHLLFCHSREMEKVRAIIDQAAPTDITVLIEGESGTGKELVAQAVHFQSRRSRKPFIKLNCAAIPAELLESEFFGFERGAFTGAHAKKPGKFELGNDGTIFLDEIGNLDVSLQAKLLQVLQDNEFHRLGGQDAVCLNARFIASSKPDLRNVVEEGGFREDLYYRLNVVNISLPPLRERKEEIPSLCTYFFNLYNLRYGRSHPGLSSHIEDVFLHYHWPGNVRQLEAMIKRMVILGEEASVVREISEEREAPAQAGLPEMTASQPIEEASGTLKDVSRKAAKEAEKEVIARMLVQTRWNRRKAAELLQISYKALLYKIKEYGLDL